MNQTVTISKQETLVHMQCGECGINFMMPDWKKEACLKDSKNGWHCPNGHGRAYSKSELDRTREMLEQANRKNTALANIIAEEQTAKKKAENKLKRQTKRIHAGVCPCCNRTFQNLARHMTNKHPEKTK